MDLAFIEDENDNIVENGVEFFYQRGKDDQMPFAAHIHSAVEILYFYAGKYRISVNDTDYDVMPGDLVLCRSNTAHRGLCVKAGGYHVIKIAPSLIVDFASHRPAAEYLLLLSLSGAGGKTRWTAEELRKNGAAAALETLAHSRYNDDPCGDLALKTAIFAVLVPLLRDLVTEEPSGRKQATDATVRGIYAVTQHIHREYGQPLTAEECARVAGMSLSHFSRSFKLVTGKGFKEYLNVVRVNQAEKLLLTENISVTEAGSRCGFDNVSYFISVYRRIKNMTPYKTIRQSKTAVKTSEIPPELL